MIIMGFDQIKKMYRRDQEFKELYEACENLLRRNKSPWIDYMLQEGLLFICRQLCIPRCSMRENLLQEKHDGGLVGHFGQDNTYA